MEIKAIQNAIGNKLSRLTAKAHGNKLEACTHKRRPALGLFNIYGRIMFKQKRAVHHTIGTIMKAGQRLTVG